MVDRPKFSVKLVALLVLPVIAVGAGAWLFFASDLLTNAPANSEQVAFGSAIYSKSCAACHGANLEGQPNWRDLNDEGKFPAPPHDVSGHTWHHADRLLLEIIEDGTASALGGSYVSDMPGFADILSEEEILAVLAFIKNSWPDTERDFQEKQTEIDVEVQASK